MAYVSVAEWRPEQVTEWLKGLDNNIVSYIHWFSNNEVNGQQLLNLSPDELTHLGVYKLGHQELILEAVQHLRNFHYELDRENLQLLALKLSCAAHSLHNEIKDQAESSSVPTQIMADVANVIHYVKPLVSWLDRPPFAGQMQYADCKSQLLSLSLEMATCAQRDRFAETPVAEIRTCSSKLAKLADSIVQDISDPMILQPATLDLATIKKKVGEELDFFLVPSFHGIHQIGDMKLSSPAHQSGKIQQGDEIVQVNYQTVVGWSRKKVLALFEESPNDLLLTLKRRPRHVKIYGQIYMKPYRLPSRKRASPYSRWNDNLPSPRPELLTIPYFDITRTVSLPKKTESNQILEPSGTSSSSDEEFGQPSDSQSPASIRLYLPKPRASIQRRFTLSGPPRPSAQSEQFWRELQLEGSWRSSQNNSQINNSSSQTVVNKEASIDEMFHLRDKSASLGNSISTASSRSTTCVSFAKGRIGSVKFDLTKFNSLKAETVGNDKTVGEERDKEKSDISLKGVHLEDNNSKNEISTENGSIKMSNSSSQESLSISKLNKIKRDAFFNNMDCSKAFGESGDTSETERSSEKVTRATENFKSEVTKINKDTSEIDILKSPGKVMELVENFEKKETPKNKQDIIQNDKAQKPIRERSRLDKSCSTPAYDTEKVSFKLESLDDIKKNLTEKLVLDHKNKSDHINFNNKIFKANDDRENICFGFEHTETFLKGEKCKEKEKIKIDGTEDESKANLDNLTIRNDRETENSFSEPKSQDLQKLEVTSDLKEKLDSSKNIKTNGQGTVSKSEDILKPVPAQRKSKLPPELPQNVIQGKHPCPLPPKPRSKPLPLSPDETASPGSSVSSTAPEPPPRPDSTIPKPPFPVKKIASPVEIKDFGDHKNDVYPLGDSVREAPEHGVLNRKSNIVISPPVSTPAGVFTYDFKPLSAAGPPSLAKKPTKTLNILSPGAPSSFASGEKEKPKSGASTLESLKAMLTLGRKSNNFNSPRSIRKKNAMLAKKRNVSAKEITSFDNSGFLWHRNRKGTAVASWTKYYFVLQGSNFYAFKSKESNKADLFIHLPGFTCTPAEEVKSKEYSFKIYHAGTVFYFAANSKEDLQQWLDSVNLAISFQDDKFLPESVTFSQTDSDTSDTEPEQETCFPTSPKIKKGLGSSPVPKPATSHQNLASESKRAQDVQKRFGSLKKLSSHKHSSQNTLFSGGGESTEVASLDRKYLRFLGQKNSPTPVRTSRFRSYRRMQPPSITPPKEKSKLKSKNLEGEPESSNLPNDINSSRLTKKPLHSSNPSLIHPEMADYRVTQERLAEFRRLRNENATPEFNRFTTADQFLARREESFRSNRTRLPELSGFMTLEQFLLCQEEERQRSLRLRDRPAMGLNEFSSPEQLPRSDEDWQKPTKQNNTRGNFDQNNLNMTNQNVRPQNVDLDKPQLAPRIRCPVSNNVGKLKNVAMYQPPPIPHSASTSSQGEDPIVLAFEMALDQNDGRKVYGLKQSLEDTPRAGECHHIKSSAVEYSGIEYPPAFEPETYTLQHMLKNRQKKDSDAKK